MTSSTTKERMMAIVTQFWAPQSNQSEIYQAWGTMEWIWPMGDNSFYWGFTVRPKSASTEVEVLREWTVSDRNIHQEEHFLVRIAQPIGTPFPDQSLGGFLQFTAIKVQA
jgi:hypothetical protein